MSKVQSKKNDQLFFSHPFKIFFPRSFELLIIFVTLQKKILAPFLLFDWMSCWSFFWTKDFWTKWQLGVKSKNSLNKDWRRPFEQRNFSERVDG